MTVKNIQISLVEQVLDVLKSSVLGASDLSSLDRSVQSSLECLLNVVKHEDSLRQVSSENYVESCLLLIEDLQKTIFTNALSYADSTYALGQRKSARRVPQIFFTHPKLTQSQLEDLAIDTEKLLNSDLNDCPSELEENLFDCDHVDNWINLDSDSEILEFYLVSYYLGAMLSHVGEPVYRLSSGGFVWGRTCSGQAISLDCTIQKALALEYGWLNDEDQDDDQNDLED